MRYTDNSSRILLSFLILALLGWVGSWAAEPADPVLNLLLEKGVISQQELERARAEAAAIRQTNEIAMLPESKWKIGNGIKSVELFGDLPLRYENRASYGPGATKLELDRGRVAFRVGLRGEVLDDFYYGFRLDTASNPRSPWITFGTSSSGVPYNGPYGKSTAGVNIGQIYLGWRPTPWLDITGGKMPNPLFTTPMVWDSDLNPEGAAERFKYTIGQAEFFATFGQFLYQDVNPSSSFLNGLGTTGDAIFQIAWQGGFTYHFNTNTSAKIAATLYKYIGLKEPGSLTQSSPFFSGPFVGEGVGGGDSGYPTSGTLSGIPSLGFPVNQVGLNHLLVLEVPFEFNFKISKLNARIFGDFGYNFEGAQRAEEAHAAYAFFLQNGLPTPTTINFEPQTQDVKSYQAGFALGNLGMVYGQTAKKNTWEFRTYWQHVEQYALDPNLLDSDFFEGRGNLEGIFAGVAYGITDNVIGTVRYGYGRRINDKIGTGGSNQDIPQINPMDRYHILQLDMTLRF